MSENPLEFGMVYVVAKLTLCYVFQRVLFFVVYEGPRVKPCSVRATAIFNTYFVHYTEISGEADMEYAMIDGSIVKVHHHSQGAKGGP